jgi:hypothetical protein
MPTKNAKKIYRPLPTDFNFSGNFSKKPGRKFTGHKVAFSLLTKTSETIIETGIEKYPIYGFAILETKVVNTEVINVSTNIFLGYKLLTGAS